MINYPRSEKTGLGKLIPSWKLVLGGLLTLAVVGAGRTHATFQASNPEEVIDPAGQPPATFALTAALIQGWSRTVAELL